MVRNVVIIIEIMCAIVIIPAFYFIFNSEINNLILLLDPFFDENTLVSRLASLGGAVTLAVLPIAFFAKRFRDGRNERSKVSSTLYRELQDTLNSLDADKYPNDAYSFKINNNRDVYFMNRFLNHDFYDSMVFSGKIVFLRSDMQQDIQNIFNQIKRHNEYLSLVDKINNDDADEDEEDNYISKKSHKYYIWMDEHEQILLKKIPKILKNLEDDFRINLR